MDRRSEDRCDAAIPVRIGPHRGPTAQTNGAGHDGYVVELSHRGARLVTCAPYGQGDLVQLDVVRPNRKKASVGHRLTVVGQVAWRHKAGPELRETCGELTGRGAPVEMGIEFRALDPCFADWVTELFGDGQAPSDE